MLNFNPYFLPLHLYHLQWLMKLTVSLNGEWFAQGFGLIPYLILEVPSVHMVLVFVVLDCFNLLQH